VRYSGAVGVTWLVGTGAGTGAEVVTTVGGGVVTGPGEGIIGCVHPEKVMKQKRMAIPIANRSLSPEEEGNGDIYGDWLTGFLKVWEGTGQNDGFPTKGRHQAGKLRAILADQGDSRFLMRLARRFLPWDPIQ